MAHVADLFLPDKKKCANTSEMVYNAMLIVADSKVARWRAGAKTPIM